MHTMYMHECLACPSAQSAGVEAWIRHLAEAHVMPTEWTSQRAARLVGPAARTPYTLITESKKKRCRGSVPRPLNSFMIFAQHIRRNVLRVFGKASNSVISRQLGEIWRTLPRPVKERYDAEAARLVKIHQIEFPDYKYQPKKKTPASVSTNLLSGGCDVHRKRAATMPSVNNQLATSCLPTSCHAARLYSLSTTPFSEDSSKWPRLNNTLPTSPSSIFSRFTPSPSSASSADAPYSNAYPFSPFPSSASSSSSSSSCSCSYCAAPQETCETSATRGGSPCFCENHCQTQSRQRYISASNAPSLTEAPVFARTASCSLHAFQYQAGRSRASVEPPMQTVHSKQQTAVLGINQSECSLKNYPTNESLSDADSGVFSHCESDAYAWNYSCVTGPVENELHSRTTWRAKGDQNIQSPLYEAWQQAACNEHLDFRPILPETEMDMATKMPQQSSTPIAPLRTPSTPTVVCQRSDGGLCCCHLSNLLSDDMEPILRTDSGVLQSVWSIYT